MSTSPSIGILLVVKNEAPYLMEWLAHHRLLGVKHFFIADNESTDGTTELLSALQKAGLVVHHKFITPVGQKPHVPALRMMLKQHRDDIDWLVIIDADEYLWPTGQFLSLHNFIANFQNSKPNVGAVNLNWATYGSSQKLIFEDDLVVKRFTWHAAQNNSVVNQHIKSILRVKAIKEIHSPHYASLLPNWHQFHTDGSSLLPLDHSVAPQYRNDLSKNVIWDHFRVNHYVIKSYQEFIQKKQARGRAFTNFSLDDHFFIGHDFADEQTVLNDEYLTAMVGEMDFLKKITARFDFDCDIASENLLKGQKQFIDDRHIPHIGYIDSIDLEHKHLRLVGWVLPFRAHHSPVVTIEVRIGGSGAWCTASSYVAFPRPDVQQHHQKAPIHCGFIAIFPLLAELESCPIIEARAVNSDGFRTTAILHAPDD